jgi:hypothetical protein
MSNYLRERIRQESNRQAGTEKDNSELHAFVILVYLNPADGSLCGEITNAISSVGL